MVVSKPPIDNLGTRHQSLNARVNEAAACNLAFDTVKYEPESSAIDKLYKIDLAAKYKNLDYILEVLKTGDSLYITRALKKCQWIYEDEYSEIINPKYLQKNIFRFISMKMKRKIVKAVAAHVTTPHRAAEFFNYCMAQQMKSTAFTCLLYTTDDFKLDQLRNNKEDLFEDIEDKNMVYFRFLVGTSFEILEALLDFMRGSSKARETVRHFRNFFLVSENKYLDLAEKHISKWDGYLSYKFDRKLSDAIMKKHKSRVLSNPIFYVNTVDTAILVRNSTIDDAKIYAEALFPDFADEFWTRNVCTEFKFILEIIPHENLYAFFKNYFTSHYPSEEFDMDLRFYEQDFYKFMTFEQREQWAWQHLKSEKQILGAGCDFIWFKFISFEAAFEEIKRLVSITKDADTRSAMVVILIKSARNDRELEALFKYYNKRHLNEGNNKTKTNKDQYIEIFLNNVLFLHNVFEFDHDCWASFYSLLLAKDLLNKYTKYKTIAILWNILHETNMPQELLDYLLKGFKVEGITTYLNNMTEQNKQQLHEYFFTFYMNLFTESKTQTFDYRVFHDDVKRNWYVYQNNIDTTMKIFNESGEPKEIPKTKEKKERYICPDELNGRSLLRDLKKDKDIVVNKLDSAQKAFQTFTLKINTFLKKLKIYFHDDVAKIYLDMFENITLNTKSDNEKTHRSTKDVVNAVKTGVNAIFHLADEDVKTDFMKKYSPVASRKDREELGVQHLYIQRAICRYACMSEPPVPLSTMVMYMKGDYVKYCLHIFNTYLALLPIPLCQQFVSLIIDSPVSIQKHAIRMAFRCFDSDMLKETIVNIWRNTKNVSLRSVIYKSFHNKVLETEEHSIYDVLKTLTLDINQDDEDEVFELTVASDKKLPEEFLGDIIEAVWDTVKKFKDIEPNITRKTNVINCMRNYINLVSEEYATTVVNQHIDTMIRDNNLAQTYSEENISELLQAKWKFVAHYIIHYPSNENPLEKYVQLAQYIVRKTIQSWDERTDEMYVYQNCCWDFFKYLKDVGLKYDYVDEESTVAIFEGILKIVDSDLQFYDSYLLKWELQLIILSAKLIITNRSDEEEIKDVIIDRSTKQFGQGVTKIVIDNVQNNTYSISFSSKIKSLIHYYVEVLLKITYRNMYNDSRYRNWSENIHGVLISVASILTEVESVETYLLAAQILPTDIADPNDCFENLILKLQKFRNADVQLYVYQNLQEYCKR